MRDNGCFRPHSDLLAMMGTHLATRRRGNMRLKVIGAALLCSAGIFAAYALSAPTGMRARMRAACEPDVQKLCANVERGKHGMRSCLDAHQNDLTAACKAVRAERAAARAKERS